MVDSTFYSLIGEGGGGGRKGREDAYVASSRDAHQKLKKNELNPER